jgi:hypothetical protein
MLDRLGVLDETLRSRIDTHRLHASVGIERIGARAERPANLVLEEAVDKDHIPAGEFLAARHFLPDELALMNDELDVEALHPAAGLALAAIGLLDVAEPLAEREIGLSTESCRSDPSTLSATA